MYKSLFFIFSIKVPSVHLTTTTKDDNTTPSLKTKKYTTIELIINSEKNTKELSNHVTIFSGLKSTLKLYKPCTTDTTPVKYSTPSTALNYISTLTSPYKPITPIKYNYKAWHDYCISLDYIDRYHAHACEINWNIIAL